MLQQPRSLKRSLVAGLAVCAIAPAGAVASPIVGQGVAAGGGPGVSAKDFPQQTQAPQDLRTPDQVDGRGTRHARLIPRAAHTSPVTASSNGDVDTGVWIALGGIALIATGGFAAAGHKRSRTARQRQLA